MKPACWTRQKLEPMSAIIICALHLSSVATCTTMSLDGQLHFRSLAIMVYHSLQASTVVEVDLVAWKCFLSRGWGKGTKKRNQKIKKGAVRGSNHGSSKKGKMRKRLRIHRTKGIPKDTHTERGRLERSQVKTDRAIKYIYHLDCVFPITS